MKTGRILRTGPLTEEQKAWWEKVQRWIADILSEIDECQAILKDNPANESLRPSIHSNCALIERLLPKMPKWRFRLPEMVDRNLEWPEQLQKSIDKKKAHYQG